MIITPEDAKNMLAEIEGLSAEENNLPQVKKQYSGTLEYARAPETLAAALNGAELAIKNLVGTLQAGGELALVHILAEPALISSACLSTVAVLLADYERGVDAGGSMSADELRRLFER